MHQYSVLCRAGGPLSETIQESEVTILGFNGFICFLSFLYFVEGSKKAGSLPMHGLF